MTFLLFIAQELSLQKEFDTALFVQYMLHGGSEFIAQLYYDNQKCIMKLNASCITRQKNLLLVLDETHLFNYEIIWRSDSSSEENTNIPKGNCISIITKCAKLLAPIIYCSTRFSEMEIANIVGGARQQKRRATSLVFEPLPSLRFNQVQSFLKNFLTFENSDYAVTLISSLLQGRIRLVQIFLNLVASFGSKLENTKSLSWLKEMFGTDSKIEAVDFVKQYENQLQSIIHSF